MGDAIHRPDHYCFSEYEPRKVIHSWGLNFNLGNAVKYLVRAGKKDDIIQDLKKAQEYIGFEIEEIEKERVKKEPLKHENCKCNMNVVEGVRIESLLTMSMKEFRERYLHESSADAYHYDYVDMQGNKWILVEIKGTTLRFDLMRDGKCRKTLSISLMGV